MNLIVGSAKHPGVKSFILEYEGGQKEIQIVEDKESGIGGINILGDDCYYPKKKVTELVDMGMILAIMDILTSAALNPEFRRGFESMTKHWMDCDDDPEIVRYHEAFTFSSFCSCRSSFDAMMEDQDADGAVRALQISARKGRKMYEMGKVLMPIVPRDIFIKAGEEAINKYHERIRKKEMEHDEPSSGG